MLKDGEIKVTPLSKLTNVLISKFSEEKSSLFNTLFVSIFIADTSKDFKSCRDRAIKLLSQIDWKEGFFRKDIGFKVIDK